MDSTLTLEAPPKHSANSAAKSKLWIYGPWLDLLAGCGAWSAPLLLLAFYAANSKAAFWPVAFYSLALLFNYPHFMATVYRAYHSYTEFQRYRIFTVHVALLLAVAGLAAHLWFPLLPWIFTLYICWSPWHYTGQNFGLLMMFARRGGISVQPLERRLIHSAFAASFLMLMLSFHTGLSGDPLILSLGLPSQFTVPARDVLAAVFIICIALAITSLSRRASMRSLLPILLLASTQFLWFLLPAAIELFSGREVPQTRYSSGILAVLHSVQYIWITSYYQRREAIEAGKSNWSMRRYLITLIAGGIALFIPGPWIASRVFHADFAKSFLTFTALVNLHHFLLDGALWKLRDSRVGSLLLGNRSASATAPAPSRGIAFSVTAWLTGTSTSARILRISAIALLFAWAVLDQLHFFWASQANNVAALTRAARLNEQDSTVQLRLARVEAAGGHLDAALAALQQAATLDSANSAIQERYARGLIEAGHTQDAFTQYRSILERWPKNTDALVNYGLLAAQLGHPDEAVDNWQRAVALDPKQTNAQLYLAQSLEQRGELQAAARHYRAYLQLAAAANPSQINRSTVISALIKVADSDAAANRVDDAQRGYSAASQFATKSGETALQSLALAHQADLLEKSGQFATAAQTYQQALAIDNSLTNNSAVAVDWFNYAQFLRRRNQLSALVYVCLLRAEELAANSSGSELPTITQARGEVETNLGVKAASVRHNRDFLVQQALSLKMKP